MVMNVEDILKKPEADLPINYIADRRRKGLYSLILVTGLPGTGKTSSCFRLAELTSLKIEKNIIDIRVITTLKDLADFAMNSKPDELNLGVVEEVSVLFPSRRAMSGENVDVARILDTCRKKRIILFANAPILKSIDSHLRALANIYVETLKIYKLSKIVVSKTFRLQTNPGSGKTYTHSFHRDGKDVTKIYTKMPNLTVWDNYEKEKDAFMEKLYIKIKARAENREFKENKELGIVEKSNVRIRKPLTAKEMKTYELINVKSLSVSEAAGVLGVNPSTVTRAMQSIQRKLGFSQEKQMIAYKHQQSLPNNLTFKVLDEKNLPEKVDIAS
jgi:DNA-binding CsgD family transcriptional regulator